MTEGAWLEFLSVSDKWLYPGMTSNQAGAARRILDRFHDGAVLAVAEQIRASNASSWPDFKDLAAMLKAKTQTVTSQSPSVTNRAWFCAVSGDFGGDWSRVSAEKKAETLEWLLACGPKQFAGDWASLTKMLQGDPVGD